ncbi:MAG: PAS domain S-box protein [Dehalococcoidales bacterium]|nr:PAS domain S-box protein [Dehalococcoidales bacterium]
MNITDIYSTGLFEKVFSFIPDIAVIIDNQSSIRGTNRLFREAFSPGHKDILGQDLFEVIGSLPHETQYGRQSIEKGNADRQAVNFELSIEGANASSRRIRIDSQYLEHFSQGLRICVINFLPGEPTEESSAKNSGELTEHNAGLNLSLSSDGSLLSASREFLERMGYHPGELPALNLADIVREDQIPACFTILDRVKQGQGKEQMDTVFVKKDGGELYVKGHLEGIFENGRFSFARSILQDISRSNRMTASDNDILNNFPAPVFVVQNGILRLVNPRFQAATEYSESELLGREGIKLVHPEDRSSVQKNFTRMININKPAYSEFRLIRKSGEARWVSETIVPIHYKGENVGLGTLVDLTEWKVLTDALDESKNRYQTLFNSSSDAVYIVDMQHRFLEVNDAACKMLGYSRNEFFKIRLDDIKTPDYIQYVSDKKNAVSDKVSFSLESECITRDGKLVPVESHCTVIEYEKKKAILTVMRDVSERKLMEQIQKRTQRRLESTLNIAQFKSGHTRDLLYFALEEMVKLTDSSLGYLYLYDENKREFSLSAWSEDLMKLSRSKEIHNVCTPDQSGLIAELVKQRRPVITHESQKPSITANGYPEGDYEVTNSVSIPVLRDDAILALVGVANKNGSYDDIDVQQLTLLISSVWNIFDRRIAEEALRDSEQRYRQLIELSQDGILRIDENKHIVTVNQAACRIFGYSEEELSGMPLSRTYTRENQAQSFDRLHRLKNTQHRRFERIARRKDGSVFPAEVSISPLTQGFYLEVIRDITERKKMENELQESERKYKLLVENQTDLLVELTSFGELLFVNPAFCKLVEKSRQELLGIPLISLFHEDDISDTPFHPGTVPDVSPTTYSENRLLTGMGWRWIAWTINAVLDNRNNIVARTCMGRDITESKLAREELEKANRQLTELDKLKDNFLSTVSHELRTPLTSIKSFAEILLNYDEDKATQREFLGIINQESDRLTRLINDFLDLSKIQAGRMQWQTTELSLADAIHSAVTASRPLIQKAGLVFSVEVEPDLPPVMCDKDRLIQVITNLLGNAVKFTPENGKISVRAGSDRSINGMKGNAITVTVTDTGIGIAPENHQRIFEKFGQVGDVLKDRPKGTGLGLPICKKIIEHYGGQIWVESELGKGTTFLFTLPVIKDKKMQAVQAEDQASDPLSSTCKTILVVDDEANIRRFIRHELTARGHKVIEASGGKEAVDLARKHHPDLITLDIAMPDLDGFDVTAVLKNDTATSRIPILIISVVEDKQKAYTLGANDYITKPISIDILLQRVNHLLKENRGKILITDDDQNLSHSLEFELKKRGFTTFCACNGKEALSAVDSLCPDLILLDIMMPVMDGYEVLSHLKSKETTKNIPIIIMTGVEIDGARVKALSLGADEYIQKSAGFERLFEVVEKFSAAKTGD